MEDKKKSAKMNALKELHKMASDQMSDDMGDLQKVTVAAKDKKGLKAGLEKAEEIISKKKDKEDEEYS